MRIRDPVTSKVRTIYLSDTQIEELTLRHEMEKNKVNKIQVNNIKMKPQQQQQQFQKNNPKEQENIKIESDFDRKNVLLKKGRQPLNFNSTRDLLANDKEATTFEFKNLVSMEPISKDLNLSDQTAQSQNYDSDMKNMLERHMTEKQMMSEIQTSSQIILEPENDNSEQYDVA